MRPKDFRITDEMVAAGLDVVLWWDIDSTNQITSVHLVALYNAMRELEPGRAKASTEVAGK